MRRSASFHPAGSCRPTSSVPSLRPARVRAQGGQPTLRARLARIARSVGRGRRRSPGARPAGSGGADARANAPRRPCAHDAHACSAVSLFRSRIRCQTGSEQHGRDLPLPASRLRVRRASRRVSAARALAGPSFLTRRPRRFARPVEKRERHRATGPRSGATPRRRTSPRRLRPASALQPGQWQPESRARPRAEDDGTVGAGGGSPSCGENAGSSGEHRSLESPRSPSRIRRL